jgi:hypothetical protein
MYVLSPFFAAEKSKVGHQTMEVFMRPQTHLVQSKIITFDQLRMRQTHKSKHQQK